MSTSVKQLIAVFLGIAVVAVLFIFGNVYFGGGFFNNSGDMTGENNITTEDGDGLVIEDKEAGAGQLARAGQLLSVHYTGTLENGVKFDSSLDRGEPFQFVLGAGQVIKGWDRGLSGMRVGGKRHLVIPPGLAYGEREIGSIPPNSTLIFDVELLGVQDR